MSESFSLDFRCENVNTTQVHSYSNVNLVAPRQRFCYTSVFQERLSFTYAKDTCSRLGGALVTNGPQLDFWMNVLGALHGK